MQQPRFADEMKKMRREPLLDAEKRLIRWSLGLGIVLLVVLAVVARVLM
jgi:hypothetical protein